MLQQQAFDAVLMDIQMPVMDGLQATAAIRALPDPTKARVPIVAMTAYAMAQDRARCLTAGMDAYLTKPVASQELIEVVERLAQAAPVAQAVPPPSPAESPIVPPAPSAEPADAAEPAFDLAAAMEQLGGREQLFRDMVTYFETQTGEVFAEIRQAQDDGDADALARAAHALKGTLVYLGAAPAVTAVQRVVQLCRAGDLAAAAAGWQEKVSALWTAPDGRHGVQIAVAGSHHQANGSHFATDIGETGRGFKVDGGKDLPAGRADSRPHFLDTLQIEAI